MKYEYDILDQITYIGWKNSFGSTILSFDYQYNAAGMITNRVTQTGLSGSAATGYGYDDLDRLIREDSGDSWAEYSYDLAGNRQTKTGGDFAVSYTSGSGNRLASWDAGSTNGFESFRTLEVRGSSSEPIGTDNRWGQLWVSNSVAVVPEIDGTNFWINTFVTGVGTQQVVAAIRDAAGNMGYATNEFFLTVVTNAVYSYNEAGCLTNITYSGADYEKNVSLGWNSQYELTSVDEASNFVSYTYDVLGRRASRTEGTNVEHFVYDGNQVTADLDGNGNILRSYTWGSGIDNLLAITTHGVTGTSTYYALNDHLNTVHALIDASGQIVERYEFDAWGRTTVFDSGGNELSKSAVGNRYCFQGREIDWKTGLYHFRARTYDPVSGRWLSNDPSGISGGLNQYVAFNNSPPNFIDPDGKNPLLIAALILVFSSAEYAMAPENGCDTGNSAYAAGQGMSDMFLTAGLMGGANAAFGGMKWGAGQVTKGLTTPSKYFGNKTAQEIFEAMSKKFGPPKSVRNGAKTFYNPTTQRSFNVHTDPAHGPSHVDIRQRGGFPERKYLLLEE